MAQLLYPGPTGGIKGVDDEAGGAEFDIPGKETGPDTNWAHGT